YVAQHTRRRKSLVALTVTTRALRYSWRVHPSVAVPKGQSRANFRPSFTGARRRRWPATDLGISEGEAHDTPPRRQLTYAAPSSHAAMSSPSPSAGSSEQPFP